MSLKIKNLNIDNFGIFQGKHSFKFEDGINLIKAENGHGKSTLISAIEMLLLDNYSDPYETYINNKADYFKLDMSFEWDKKSYEIILECKKSKSVTTNRVLLSDGQELANGEDAKIYLNNLINSDIGKYALTVKQKDKDSITKCKDAERRDLFKKVKNLNFDKQIDNYLNPKLEATKNDIIQVDKEIYAIENCQYKELGDKPSLPFDKATYDNKKLELEKLKADRALAEEREKQNKESQDLLDRKLVEKSKLDGLDIEKKNLLDTKDRQIKELESNLAEITSESYTKNYKDTLDKEYSSKVESITSEYQAKLKDLENKKLGFESIIKEKNTNLSNIKLKKLAKFPQDELDNVHTTMIKLESKLSIIDSNIEKLKSGICPICGSPTTDKCHNFEVEKIDIRSQYDTSKKEYDSLLEKKKEYELAKEENEKNKELKDNLSKEISNLDMRISECINSISFEEKNKALYLDNAEKDYTQKLSNFENNLKEKIANLQDRLESESANKELLKSNYQEIINNKESIAKEVELLLSKLGTYSSSNNVDFSKIEILVSEISRYESISKDIENYDKEEKEITSLKETNAKKLKDLQDRKSKLVQHQKNIDQAKVILTKEFPNWVIDNSIDSVQNAMNDFINKVYYKPLNLQFKSTKTNIKLEFGTNEKRMLPCSKLSGCEQKLTDIAFTHNFNKLLGLNTLILDEPDAPLDDNRKLTLYDSLLEMSNLYGQMFIITHSEKMCNHLMAQTESNLIML